jgi:branched-chain amino acid transport system substrate-binding protein
MNTSILKPKEEKMRKIMTLFSAIMVLLCLFVMAPPQAMTAEVNARFDVNKMGDMSDFDPNNPMKVTGDTIKIAVVASHSGPAAVNGEVFYLVTLWPAQDINKRGGIIVDGKRKMIEVIKADHQSKPAITKKVCERMVLQEKVDVLVGTNGSNNMKVINAVADKYKKVIVANFSAMSDELHDAQNFTPYSFMTCHSTQQVGRAFAYYFGQMRKKEKKFYILCQDYLFGHSLANGFKVGLKEYYPDAEIVGEDYHKLFLTDFAPYLTKIKASGAEVIYTGDWVPDLANLVKQTRQLGISLPFANIYMDDPTFLTEVGVEGTKGIFNLSHYGCEGEFFKTPEQIKFFTTWKDQWKKWEAPYNSSRYEYGNMQIGAYRDSIYWLLSVIERAGSTDPEKIMKVWEGDTYQYVNGKVMKMRPCDHKAIQELHVQVFVPPEGQKENYNIPPYYWYKEFSFVGPSYEIPAEKILPYMDPELERCKQ